LHSFLFWSLIAFFSPPIQKSQKRKYKYATMALLIFLPLLILFCLPLYYIVPAFLSPLRHVPGPFWARFTRLWKLIEIYGGHFEKTNVELHRKYGELSYFVEGNS